MTVDWKAEADKEFALRCAVEIGRDVARNGKSTILPWVHAYSHWEFAVEILGYLEAFNIADRARVREETS